MKLFLAGKGREKDSKSLDKEFAKAFLETKNFFISP